MREVVIVVNELPPIPNSLGFQVAKLLKYISREEPNAMLIKVIANRGSQEVLRREWDVRLEVKFTPIPLDNNIWEEV